MNEIFFPSQYKKALLHKTKNTTIRLSDEIGKYKVGKIYAVKSYAGSSWNMKIKIDKVIKIRFGELKKFEIPERSIASLQKNEKLSPRRMVELIRFTAV